MKNYIRKLISYSVVIFSFRSLLKKKKQESAQHLPMLKMTTIILKYAGR